MGSLEGRKILIVDDDRFIRSTIKLLLRAIDHFVVAEADDGDVALVETDGFKPDVVLCDITMPRMDGLQYVAQLRKHPDARMRDTPVAVLTGQAEESTGRCGEAAGRRLPGKAGVREGAGRMPAPGTRPEARHGAGLNSRRGRARTEPPATILITYQSWPSGSGLCGPRLSNFSQSSRKTARFAKIR
jgi:two-component system, chemotaxis family, chemotaxis protein CheY